MPPGIVLKTLSKLSQVLMILRLKVTSFMEGKIGTDAPLYLPKSVLQIGTGRLPRSLSRDLSGPQGYYKAETTWYYFQILYLKG